MHSKIQKLKRKKTISVHKKRADKGKDKEIKMEQDDRCMTKTISYNNKCK